MKNKKLEKQISCGIIPIFINENGKKEFLLVEAHHGGIGFPKGHIEGNETFLETAKRELFEETGLSCFNIDSENMISEKYTIIRPEKTIYKTVHYFIGFVSTKEVIIQAEEIRNFYWLSDESAMEKANYNNSKKVFKNALKILDKK